MKRNKITIISFILLLFSIMPIFAQSSNRYGIDIDGNVEDWKDIPKQRINFGWDNGNVDKEGAFLRDGDTIFIYIDMHPEQRPGYVHYYTKMQNWGYILTIDGVEYPLQFVGLKDTTLSPGEKRDFSIQTAYNWPAKEIPNSKGIVIGSDAGGQVHDIVEVSIPLSFFTSDTNGIKTLEFKNTLLGEQSFTFTGTPSGSTIIVISGFVIATLSLIYVYRKRANS